jgi:multidrug efflux system membrane fusion protein
MQSVESRKIVIRLPSRRILLSLLFSAILFSFFAYWYQNVRPFVTLESGSVKTFSLTLYSDLEGRVAHTSAQEGDLVKKGQTLLSLRQEALSQKKDRLEAALQSLNRQIEEQKEQMGRAMQAYLAAESEVAHIKLMEEAQEKSEQAALEAEKLKTELALLDNELKKGTLVAPFDGVVLKKYADAGAALSLGAALYLISDPTQCWIEAEIPETQLSRVSIGTPAKICLTAYPNQELFGEVSYIGPAATSKMFPIKISLMKTDLPLKPGLSAKVALKVY